MNDEQRQRDDKMYNTTKDKLRRIAPIIGLLANTLTAGAVSFLFGLTFGGSMAWGIATAVGVYAVVFAYFYGEYRGFELGLWVNDGE